MTLTYTLTLLTFLTLSGILFMLVKTWVMLQVGYIRNGMYKCRKKDLFWSRPGWVAVLVFIGVLVTGDVLLILDFKI